MSDWISMDEILSATDGAFGAKQLLNLSDKFFKHSLLKKVPSGISLEKYHFYSFIIGNSYI
jgi:hypothetical protein